MKGLLEYSEGNSFLHRLNPLTKLILSVMICIASFLSDSILLLFIFIGLNLALGASAGVFGKAVAILKGLIKISLVFFVIQIFVIRSGIVLFTLPLGIVITTQGVIKAVLIVLRLVSATMPLTLMLAITKMNDLSNVLVTKLHFPYKYAFMLTTSIRFIPIFANEMSGIMEAQTARGVEFDTRNFFKKIKLILPLCVPLLITSVKKIDGSAISAEIRGFELRTRKSCYKQYPITFSDALLMVFSAILLVLSVSMNMLIANKLFI